MGLIFNLPGAVQNVKTAQTNKERIEAANRLTEEFYRTIGVLCFCRRAGMELPGTSGLEADVLTLVRDYFATPTFDSWIRLGKLCGEVLSAKGDPFGAALTRAVATELEPGSARRAREIIVQIHALRGTKVDPPRRVTYLKVLEVMRLLRNFRSHEWDSNDLLEPVSRLQTAEFIVEVVTGIMMQLDVRVLYPEALRLETADTLEVRGTEATRRDVDVPADAAVSMGVCHLGFLPGEPLFAYPTQLLRYLPGENRIYVYLKAHPTGTAVFEAVPVVGQIHKLPVEGATLESVFGLSPGEFDSIAAEETLLQRFGKISIDNGVANNLPEVTQNYVPRQAVEADLTEKLRHRRLFLTTLDGGGGFGKTELAKKVVWDLIQAQGANSADPRFQFVVWVTGKTQSFGQRGDVKEEPSIRGLEDLVDAILYVTGASRAIGRPIADKKSEVIRRLNDARGTLLLLDNVETVEQKDELWRYLVELGDRVKSEIRVLATSRTRGGAAEQTVDLKPMQADEAAVFASNEMSRLGVAREWRWPESVNELTQTAGRVPLLIRYSVGLLRKGYTLDEIRRNTPRDTQRALEFMCGLQWNRLGETSQRLLLAISFWGGRASFAEARLLSGLDERIFEGAREELQENIFLVDDTLRDSVLSILPPIAKFARLRLAEKHGLVKDFEQARILIASKGKALAADAPGALELVDEIALNRIFQKASSLLSSGDTDAAYKAYVEATDRFPNNRTAWRLRGGFEFRNLHDEKIGEASFARAAELGPKDSVVLSEWAYWEHELGARTSDRQRLERSIELNKRALVCAPSIDEVRSAKVHIAASFLKLSNLARAESLREGAVGPRHALRESKDQSAAEAIKILADASISAPGNINEIRHNVKVNSLLASAYLMREASTQAERRSLDLLCLRHLIKAVKEAPWDPALPIALANVRVKGLLEEFGVPDLGVGREAVYRLIALEGRIRTELSQRGAH